MAIQPVTLVLTGSSPLLMSSDRCVDVMDPDGKEMNKLIRIKGKERTREIEERIAYYDWYTRMYLDATLGPYLPSFNVRKSIIQGARKTSNGKTIEQGVVLYEEKTKLLYDGPRKVDAMWKDPKFRDVRSVAVGKKKIMRYRPMFENWSLKITLGCDTTLVKTEEVLRYATTAGQLIGIGDFRPDKGGMFGRYTVEVSK